MKVEDKVDKIVGVVEIKGAPEAVFKALTDPQELGDWFGSPESFQTSDWKIDLRQGGKWSCRGTKPDGTEKTIHGVYEVIDPPKKLVYTWNQPAIAGLPETRVEFTLEVIPSGTRVHLVHTGFGKHDQARTEHTAGWTKVLGWLADYCSRVQAR